jgi:phage terminase large subunit
VIVDVALTDPQIAFVESEALYPAIVGGLGSGKSRAGTMRLVMQLIADPGANGAYYMPVYDLLTLRAMPGVEADLDELGLSYKTNRSSYTIDIHGYGTIIFRSYDRPERIIAYEVAHSICDELDTLPKDKAALVWRKIAERNRQKRDGKNTIGLVTTPDQGINGFVYEKWVKMQQPGYVLYKASTYSNPFLPPDYTEQILANYDPILAELYLNGEFVSLNQNKVYHFFNRAKHHTPRTIRDTDTVLHIGLDFNVGGTCACTFVIDNNNPVAVDEIKSHDTQDFINNLTRYSGKHCIIYPDASGKSARTNASQSDISLIAQAGFQLQYKPSNPAVRDRINAYNGLLAHNRLLVNTDTCPNLTNALETQGYDKKGEPEKWDAHPAVDDWADASGYFIAYKVPVIRAMQTAKVIGF